MRKVVILLVTIVLSCLTLHGQMVYKIQGGALKYSYGKVLVKLPSRWIIMDNTYVRLGIPTPPRVLKFHWLNDSLQHIQSTYIAYDDAGSNNLTGMSLFGSQVSPDSSNIIITGTHWGSGTSTALFMLSIMDTSGILKKMKYLSTNTYSYPGSEPFFVDSARFMFITSVRTTGNQYLHLMDTAFSCFKVWSIQTPYADYGVIRNLHIQDSLIVGIFSPSNISNGPTGCSGFSFIRIDTGGLSATAIWHYIKPTTPMFPSQMLLLEDSSYLVVGYVLDTCNSTSARRRPFALKLSLEGNIIWSRRFMTSLSGSEQIIAAVDNTDGTYVLVGTATTWSPTGDQDMFIMHIDSSGNLIKAVSMGNGGADVVHSIEKLGRGLFIMAGAIDDNPNDGSDAYTPFFLTIDTSLVIPCVDLNWTDVTSLIYIDSAHFDTTTQYSITTAGCPSWQNYSYNPTSYLDSTIILKDSVIITSDTIVNAVCYGDSGYIAVSVTGGQPPYTFVWNNYQTTNTNAQDTLFANAGSYTVYAIDETGCYSDTSTLFISQPPKLTPIIDSLNNVGCFGDSSGSIYASITGGTPPYVAWWSTNDSSLYITGLPAGDYTLFVVDSALCQDSIIINISEPPPLTVMVDTTNLPVITAIGSGGTPPYTYLWSTGDTTQVITISQTGYVSIILTDSNGCTAIDSAYLIIQSVEAEYANNNCSWTILDNNLLKISCSTISRIIITDISGKEIINKSTYSKHLLLNLNKGVYMIQIVLSSGSIKTFKIDVP